MLFHSFGPSFWRVCCWTNGSISSQDEVGPMTLTGLVGISCICGIPSMLDTTQTEPHQRLSHVLAPSQLNCCVVLCCLGTLCIVRLGRAFFVTQILHHRLQPTFFFGPLLSSSGCPGRHDIAIFFPSLRISYASRPSLGAIHAPHGLLRPHQSVRA